MIDGTNEPEAQAETREGITLDRYAEVMAHVRHFPRSNAAEVILRLGLTEPQWEAATLAWTDALAEESAREEEALSRRFGAVFVETKARLKRDQPALRSLGGLPGELASDAPAGAGKGGTSMPPAVVVVPGIVPQPDLPSFMIAAPSPGLVRDPSSEAIAAGQAAQVPAAAPPADPLSLVPVGMRGFTSLQGTQAASPDAGKKPALPFAAPAPGASPPAVERDTSAAKSAGRSEKAAPVGGETEDISAVVASLRSKGAVLPFPIPAQAAPAPTPASAGQSSPERHSAGAMGSSTPGLSLEQYASVCVELSLHPAKAEETLRRYRLTEDQRAKLDAYWQARIASDPGVAAAWNHACAVYRDWVQRR